ncbi:helix-turn-helix transcriptional regulator [Crocosphaera chwakensis]|uniref:HTH luxR-type domain-containing protein n=1 Tax=Crocosphaera chwakensis CCY0110 TaxID=391612 RepID=A3IZZ9_9CHRO|nr:helix-turn-helix transcriptional regulator [Crocosphaera chwakensis]EAZ87950.1 hypothetical protein CY0110_14645 [Crocosphaera chwakensis CCY0110]
MDDKQFDFVIQGDFMFQILIQHFSLTKKQNQLLLRLTQGLSKQEILLDLDISESNYNYYVTQLRQLFRVNTTTQLVAIAFRSGYISNLESRLLSL